MKANQTTHTPARRKAAGAGFGVLALIVLACTCGPLSQVQSLTSGDGTRQWAARATASSQYGADSWSASQATGAPDTPECGDLTTAWATAAANGVDWLRLEYDTPVTPKRIEIHQTYNPGAINQVEVTIPGGGVTHIVYQASPAPVEQCPFVLIIPIDNLDVKVGEVIVYLDQTNHTGWNEIDAVELIGVP